MRINTNIASMTAQANNAQVNKNLNNSLEKLSSGLAINKAADDASGMAIADKLRTQASSLGQGIANANSGAALIQIADKAMGEQSAILDTVKMKLIQASTSTTSSEGREAIRKDISKLLQQFDAIAEQTNYNGVNLLDKKGSEFKFQIGEFKFDNVSMTLSKGVNTESLGALAEMTDKAEGTMVFTTDIALAAEENSGEVTVVNTADDGVTIATTGVGMTVMVSGENVEDITADTGAITLKTDDAELMAKLDAIAATDGGTNFTRNGEGNYTIVATKTLDFGAEGADLTDVEMTTADADDSITIDTDGESELTVKKISAADAADITISNTATDMTGSITDTSKVTYSGGVSIKEGSLSVEYDSTAGMTASANNYAIGLNTVASSEITTKNVTLDADEVTSIQITSTNLIAQVELTTTNDDLMEKLEQAANANQYLTNNDDGTFTLKASAANAVATLDFDDDGFDVTDLRISGIEGSTVAADLEKIFVVTQESVTITNHSSDPLSVSAVDMVDKADDTALKGSDLSKSVVGDTLDAILDVPEGELTGAMALGFLDSIDAAITQVNTIRSEFGSTQNQLETAVRSMMVTQVNIKNAESVIRDVDYAAESANFNKQNIISQAGTYALSQANNVQQNVMKLLQ